MKRKSIMSQLILYVGIPFFLFVLLAIFFSSGSYYQVWKNETEQLNELVSQNVDECGERLKNYDQFLVFLSSQADYLRVMHAEEESDRSFYIRKIYDEIKKQWNIPVDATFLYIGKSREFICFSHSSKYSEEMELLSQALTEELGRTDAAFSKSYIRTAGGVSFFVTSYDESGGCIGAVSSLETIAETIGMQNDNFCLAFSENGELLYVQDNPYKNDEADSFEEQYTALHSERGMLVKEYPFYSNELMITAFYHLPGALMHPIQLLELLVLLVMAVLAVAAFFMGIHKLVISPMQNLIIFEKEVPANPGLRLAEKADTEEFHVLHQTFNDMLDLLSEVQKQAEAEHLERLEAEYNYLKTQINPHFFQNLLNTMYSMVLTKKEDEAITLIQYMSSYYRYVLRTRDAEVRIRDEISNVEEYLQLQSIRYPGLIQWDIRVEPDVMDCRIPILMLHTFVENVMDHAFTGKAIWIGISARHQSGNKVFVEIKDTGTGFSEEKIAVLNGSDYDNKELNSRIGIANIKKRIQLLYGEKGDLRLSNLEEGGAMVQVWIPERKNNAEGTGH